MDLEPLATIAELSIAIAGFSGVILVLNQRIGREGIQRFGLLISTSMLGVTCALMPFAIGEYSSKATLVWGVPIFIFGSVTFAQSVFFLSGIVRGGMSIQLPLYVMTLVPISFLLSVVCLLSPFGIGIPSTKGLLIVVLVFNLLVLATMFFASVRQVLEKDIDNADT